MKKIVLFILMNIIMLSSVYAAEVEVQINGEIINFSDTSAQIINSRTMVPFRKIFNELGITDDNIEWNGDTKTIIAKKDHTEIKLQIGNNVAEKKEGENTSKITLDSAPVISNDRTLVPLRFIAESLGKTVGWDADHKTAVIIDFDYFLSLVNTKSNELYRFLNHYSANTKVTIERKYTDGEDSSQNNTSQVVANIEEVKDETSIKQEVTVNFSGANELMKEIASEGWAEIKYENHYYDDYFTTKALTDGLKKVYGQEQLKFMYEGLKCEGGYLDSLADLLKTIAIPNEKNINIETFQLLKNEFNDLLKLFSISSSGGLTTGNISSDSLNFYYFDLTRLDNILYDSPINRVYSLLNSQIFNFDVTLEELCYDYPKMNMAIGVNNSELTIDFVLSNDYNEKVEYIIKINK